MALPDRIRAARKQAGFASQEALGRALGTSRLHVNAWETGRHAPSYAYAKKLADEFNRRVPGLGGEPEQWMAQDGHGPRRRGEAALVDAAESLTQASRELLGAVAELRSLVSRLSLGEDASRR